MTDEESKETLFEASLYEIINTPISWERTAQISYLIEILDERPGLLKRCLERYHWMELRNVFSDKLCYPEDSEDYLKHNEWTMWNGHGWELIWKRFLIELMVIYESWPKETQEHFRIMDTKEKWISVYFPNRGGGIHLPTDFKRKMDQLVKAKRGVGQRNTHCFIFQSPSLTISFS